MSGIKERGKWTFPFILGIVGMLTSFGANATNPHPYAEYVQQPPSLESPERGSVAGEFGETEWSAKDLSRGTFSLPLGLSFPQERGPLVYPIEPRYSPGGGLTEWGLGVANELSIYRFRESVGLDFKNDDLMSPWGHLLRGEDGRYYSKGFKTKVRVEFKSDSEITALLEDGSTLTFGKNALIQVSKGIYAWYLVEARNSSQQISRYVYEPIQNQFLYLKEVNYGGSDLDPAYSIQFYYETNPYSFKSYRSTEIQELKKRVKRIDVLAKSGVRIFSLRYSYLFEYQKQQTGPAFYLESIEKKYSSGKSEPKKRFEYSHFLDTLTQADWKTIDALTPVLDEHGSRLFTPSETALLDLENSGETQLEVSRMRYSRLRRTENGFVFDRLPQPTGDINRLCRETVLQPVSGRKLVRMRGPHSPLEVVVTYHPQGYKLKTVLMTCDLEGHRTGEVHLEGHWNLNNETLLVDLDHDGKPDLIQIYGSGLYRVYQNLSTSTELKFSDKFIEKRIGLLGNNRFLRILDINGDGIPDLVSFSPGGLTVWHGKGNYEFEFKAVDYPIVNSNGFRITVGERERMDFHDLNNDGILDLIIYGPKMMGVFLSDGTRFKQVEVPAIKWERLPFAKSLSGLGILPLFADFTGTGHPQVTVIDLDKAYALEFNNSNTGLLTGVEDGKGNRLEFSYEKSKSEPGVGKRISVLSNFSVKTVGKDERSYRYHFESGKTHSIHGILLGFDRVQVDQGPHHILEKFRHDEKSGTLPLSSESRDERLPDAIQFSENEYENRKFFGIPYFRNQLTRQGFRNVGKSASNESTNFSMHFQDEFCPSQVIKNIGFHRLTTNTEYVKPVGIQDHLTCLPKTIQMIGIHADRTLSDFDSSFQIERDEYGHPLSLSTLEKNARLVQKVQYRKDYLLDSIFDPSKGLQQFFYDELNRLIAVHNPDQTIVKVDQYHPVYDRLLSLSTLRGDGVLYSQSFGYDELERLSAQWNDLFESSEAHPLQSLHYQYASGENPAWIQVKQRLMSPLGEAHKVEAFIQTGSGEEITQGDWIQDHWVMKNPTWISPNEKTQKIYTNPIIPNPNLADLKVSQLFDHATVLSSKIDSFLDYPIQSQSTYQKGVMGFANTSVLIGDQVTELSHVENGKYLRRETLDAEGRVLSKTDEEQQTTRYEYDVLGRLVRVILPEGQTHELRYDSEGNITEVRRSDLGFVHFQYHPVSGLPVSKTYFGTNGEWVYKLVTDYDDKGRKTSEQWTSPGQHGKSDDSWKYLYTYDGYLPNGKKIPGQIGFLTSVQGPSFSRTINYRSDGKLLKVETQIESWRKIVEQYSYQPDGSVKSHTIESGSESGQTVDSIVSLAWEPNSFGKLGSIRMRDRELLSISYNSDGKTESIHWKDHNISTVKDSFHYDELTQGLLGLTRSIENQSFSSLRNFNDRGLIASEKYSYGSNSLFREFEYNKRKLLALDQDESGIHHYSYSQNGIWKQSKSQQQRSSLNATSTQWNLVLGENAETQKVETYLLDHFGRVIEAENRHFQYGPNGRVWKVDSSGDRHIEYSYDETGKRLFKKVNGQIVEAYLGQTIVTSTGDTLQPLKVDGVLMGILKNMEFIPAAFDFRGSYLDNQQSRVNALSVYGERDEGRNNPHLNLIEYAAQGYDSDLNAYRMEQRDYNPRVKRFLSPDPLFFEDPSQCLDSPLECNLYSYAAGNPVSFVDPTGNSPLLVAGILGGVKAITMGISYLAMQADQYFNNLAAPEVARQNNDFQAATNTVVGTTVGQWGGVSLAAPAETAYGLLTLATNPRMFEHGLNIASGFMEGLFRETTGMPNSGLHDFVGGKIGEYLGNVARDVMSTISDTFNVSGNMSTTNTVPSLGTASSSFSYESKNFGNFQ